MNKLALALLLFVTPVVNAQQLHIEDLSSPSSHTRRQFSEDLYGSGVSSEIAYDALASLVTKELADISTKDPRADEISWHIKALGASGNMKYMPVLEKAASSNVRSVAGHARGAIQELKKTSASNSPLMLPEKVRMLTETQASACKYLRQYTCDAHGNSDECLDELRDQAIEYGGNAFFILNQSEGGFGIFKKSSATANLYRCQVD